jgi:hypothetical protein
MEQFFISASVLVGIGQVADSIVLIRQRGLVRGLVLYFAMFEYLWAAFCLYLLVAGALTASRWLALSFVAYIPISFAVALFKDPRVLSQSPGSVRVPLLSVYLGGLFGVLYAFVAGLLRVGA